PSWLPRAFGFLSRQLAANNFTLAWKSPTIEKACLYGCILTKATLLFYVALDRINVEREKVFLLEPVNAEYGKNDRFTAGISRATGISSGAFGHVRVNLGGNSG